MDGQKGDYEYVTFFYPEHFDPSPVLIELPDECVALVYDELQRAFAASWNDVPSAANHLRSAVELLLDHLKEPKTVLNTKGKRARLPLHQRIVNLANRDQELSLSLLAVKWLGNVGSHSDELTKDDLYDAFDILEPVLQDLFVKHRKRLQRLVATINKRKGPRKK